MTFILQVAMGVVLIIHNRGVLRRACWFRDEDILLVNFLQGAACSLRLQTRAGLMEELGLCSARLSEHFNREVTVASLVRSLNYVRKRFRTFKRFIRLPGVVYVVRRNRVHA